MVTSLTQKIILQRSSLRNFLAGIFLSIVPLLLAAQLSLLMPDRASEFMLAALLCRIASVVLFGYSIADLAECKAHSRVYGLLVFLGPLGLLWAVGLPDRNYEDDWLPVSYAW